MNSIYFGKIILTSIHSVMSHTGNTGAPWFPNYWFMPWNFTNYLEEEEFCLQASFNIIFIINGTA